MRVHHMRCSRRNKSRKIFEYLVDELSTWIPENQLRISLSPTFSELGESLYPMSQAQSEVNSRHSVSPINDDYRHTSPVSRSPSPSALSSLAPGGEPEAGKRGEKCGRQDMHTEISGETHYSINTDDTCDTGNEGSRPAKRQRPRSTPAVIAPLQLRRSPHLRFAFDYQSRD